MIRKIKDVIACNFKSFIIFQLIFKVVTFLIFTPLFLNTFNLIMKITGYSYLTFENIFSFLTNPLTLVMIIILLLLMTVYSIFDISTIIIMIDASYQNKKISIKEAVNISWKKSLNVLKPKNILIAFLVLFLIPFMNFGINSSFITSLSVPEFVMDYIENDVLLAFLWFIIYIVLAVILLKWIFSLHYYVLEDCNFKKARQKSSNLSKKKNLSNILTITITQSALLIFYIIFVAIEILLIVVINNFLQSILIIDSFIISIVWIFVALSFVVYKVLSLPLAYSCISILYYRRKEKINEEIVHINFNSKENKFKPSKKLTYIKSLIVIVTILSGTYYTYGVAKGKFNLNIEYTKETQITAHRGASSNYPENTMSAFKAAKELGANWIELDVSQTKDGKIVVIHDENLKRITGVDKNVWELTYDEIKELDTGVIFDEKFKGEKIPLLEEVIKFAKENFIKLNIELKATGHEKDFEKTVIDIIIDEKFENDCVVSSLSYKDLENVKAYNDNIKTIYVMTLAYGNILSLDKADGFSIEATSVTKSLVKKIHNSGKEIFVWTINNEDSISKMLNLKVDNIITDDVELAKNTIYINKTSNVILEYIKWVENIFK